MRTQEVMAGALKKANLTAKGLAAIGVTNQRETTVIWDRATGKPIYNAIVWQDTRTADICNKLAKQGGQNRFRKSWLAACHLFFGTRKLNGFSTTLKAQRQKRRAARFFLATWIRG